MSSRASSSRASYRSMEILSPEPPKELDIPLDSDSEAEKIEKSKQKDKRAKKVRVVNAKHHFLFCPRV